MVSSYMLEDFEIKNKKAFVKTFYIGTIMWIGCVIYYTIQGH